jgi:hypothetical protein
MIKEVLAQLLNAYLVVGVVLRQPETGHEKKK